MMYNHIPREVGAQLAAGNIFVTDQQVPSPFVHALAAHRKSSAKAARPQACHKYFTISCYWLLQQ